MGGGHGHVPSMLGGGISQIFILGRDLTRVLGRFFEAILRQSLWNQICEKNTFKVGCVYRKSPLVFAKSDAGYILVYYHS